MKDFPAIRLHELVKPAAERPARFLHILWAQDDQSDDDNKYQFLPADAENFHIPMLCLLDGLLDFMLVIRERAKHAIDKTGR